MHEHTPQTPVAGVDSWLVGGKKAEDQLSLGRAGNQGGFTSDKKKTETQNKLKHFLRRKYA